MKNFFSMLISSCFFISLLFFTSCSNLFDSSIEFSFDKSIISAARNTGSTEAEYYIVSVTVKDEAYYEETKIIAVQEYSQSVKFDNITTGSEVTVEVRIFPVYMEGDSRCDALKFYGKAELTVKSGVNTVDISAKDVYPSSEDDINKIDYESKDGYTLTFYYDYNYYDIKYEGEIQTSIGLYSGNPDNSGALYFLETGYKSYTSGDLSSEFTIISDPEYVKAKNSNGITFTSKNGKEYVFY